MADNTFSKGHALYLCGATDCFLHAVFDEYGSAEEYALSLEKAGVMNPEGWIIKEVEFEVRESV